MDWYFILLIVLGCLVVAYTILAYVISRIVLNMATKPRPHTYEEARVHAAELNEFDFSIYDNEWRRKPFSVVGKQGNIVGEFIYSPNHDDKKAHKVVVIAHGHTWNHLNSLKYAKIFYDLGYDVCVYDHAYFGKSDGDFTTLGFYEKYDLSNVVDKVKAEFGNDSFVGLHGESMGAATVLGVLGLRKDIDFVVADCPFSDTMRYYREVCKEVVHLPGFPIVDFANCMAKKRFGYDFKKFRPIEAVEKSETPICFVHGKADRYIFPHNSQDMFNVSKSKLSEIHLIDGAKHASSFTVDKEKYAKIVADFTSKVENASSKTI